MHLLGLTCKASFCLRPHSPVNPHVIPLRNSCNGKMGVIKMCMSRWKGIADCLPLRRNHLLYAIVWHCGRGGHIGTGTGFVQGAGEMGTHLTQSHSAPGCTFALRFPHLAKMKVETKFKNLPRLYQSPVRRKLEIQTSTIPGTSKHSYSP